MRHDRERRAAAPQRGLLFFLSLPSSHQRRHFPCMWCQRYSVHYLACHHTPAALPPPKACQMLLGRHGDIQGSDLFSEWQWSATAAFAKRQSCPAILARLNVASIERHIEHLSQEAIRLQHIYQCIYLFIVSLQRILNPWVISKSENLLEIYFPSTRWHYILHSGPLNAK